MSHCPEILNTIDQLISSVNNLYECTYPLSYAWVQKYPVCYVIQFSCPLSEMETYNPISYLDAFNQIKGCFKWSNITCEEYYAHRVPQRVFDNRYLIQLFLDVYIYAMKEQYGSLQPGSSIPPHNLEIFKIENNGLASIK